MNRTLLMVPGPVEITSEVLAAQARPALSHVGPEFRDLAGAVLGQVRALFDAPSAQPVVVAGSGTLGMEIALANLLEPGDRLLIFETGVFARRFADIARRLGADVHVEPAPLGQAIDADAARKAIQRVRPKVVTITQVDTSTGIRVDVPTLVTIAHENDALAVVDGVCSVGGEEYHGDAWGVDIGFTASQKALAAPPGVTLLSVNARARAVRENRKAPFTGFFTDLLNWFPVMEGYEAADPRYFGTPPVTLFASLLAALEAVFEEGLSERIRRHARVSAAFKAGIAAIGLPNLASDPQIAANTLSVPMCPEGIADRLAKLIYAEGVTVSGAIHPDLRGRSFRVGHMGICGPGEALTTLAAIERAALRAGLGIDLGAGLAAAQRVLVGTA